MGEAKKRKHEIEALKAKGKKVEHTREERIAAIVDSMREFPSWWEKRIALCRLAKSGGTMCLADPWGGCEVYEPSFLIDLWNKVKAA